MEREGLSGFELLVLVVGGATAAVIGVVWAGAALALLMTGAPAAVSVGDAASAVPSLSGHLGDPAAAWPEPLAGELPGPLVYWSCTALVATGMGAVAAAGVRLLGMARVGTVRRRPLGVDARSRFATRRDLAPLVVRGAVAGRFAFAHFGRHLLATEARFADEGRSMGPRRQSRRWGNRGAVALVGPSQSGKTTAAVAGILGWTGPAVLSSVKADLLAPTVGWRSKQGEVRVYDPTGVTATPAPKAAWSPLRQAGTVAGAQRAARALCDAAPKGNVEGGLDFWLAQAEILLSGLLFVAHHTKRNMGAVCEWVLTQDRPGEMGPGAVQTGLYMLGAHEDAAVAFAALEASRGLTAVWDMEDRTRSSIYATAQTVVWPWSEAGVAASSTGDSIDLDWLLSGANTVYLCAPLEDQRRLAPAFGGLLNDFVAQAYRRVAETGKPLDPPLLVVIDEAGNTPLRSLPEYASTLAGIGVLLVTIWQSLAQIEATYQRQADTILTNHLTKLFYAGLSDGASLRYLNQVLGDAEIETRSRSNAERLGKASLQLATTRAALAPAHALRQMRPGDALLLHGTLPPAHVRTRPYYRDRQLRERATHPVVEAKRKPGKRTLLAAANDNTTNAGGKTERKE